MRTRLAILALLVPGACGSATVPVVRDPVVPVADVLAMSPTPRGAIAAPIVAEVVVRPGAVRDPEPGTPGVRRDAASFPYLPRRLACEEVARIARQAAGNAGLETGLLVGVMRVESTFVVNAISVAAAVGLSQVLPSIGEKLSCGDLFDPAANAACGATVLARWLARFDGNIVSALSGYNAGHGMPTHARDERRVPRNFQYVEDVLRARSRFLRHGCRAWDERVAR